MWLPWLPAENARLRGTAPPDKPFALIEKERGALRIAALCREAAAIGLTPGMPLADARAQVPGFAAVPADPEADATLLRRLALLCRRYSPSVTDDPPRGLLIDIAGCTHGFAAGEEGLRADLLARLARERLSARAACAGTPDAARALARFGCVDVRALPLDALELSEDAHQALRRSGFRSIGDLADLPSAPLAARFGTDLPVRLARLLGREDRHIAPLPVEEPVEASLSFAEPIGRADDVLDAVEALLVDLARQLERRGEGGRAFALRLDRSDGHVARLTVETGEPTRDAAIVLRLLRERMESLADPLDPGFGYDAIGMAVPRSEPLAEEQAALGGETRPERRRAGRLGALLDRIRVRHGREAVRSFRSGASHVPERAGWLGDGVAGNDWPSQRPGDPPMRPLALFDPPQRVEVLAAVPDGPPRRFRWRGHSHEVIRQEGPERIAPEWWLRVGGHDANPGLTRDYYRVEDAEGRRFWLFRHGLYDEAPHPDWYLHGLFA